MMSEKHAGNHDFGRWVLAGKEYGVFRERFLLGKRDNGESKVTKKHIDTMELAK